MAQAPIALALLVCDTISLDPTSKKTSLLGCFSGIASAVFPAVMPRLLVYLELTDGHGEVSLVLKLARVTADSLEAEIVFRAETTVLFSDPRAVMQFDLALQPVVFPQPGEYRLIIESASGALIIERRLTATLNDSKGTQ
jgi:hypothetical protein